MKKIFISLSALIVSLQSFAQEMDPTDAIRFSQTALNGTARFNAMGGAFGAVGSDISSIHINPAGSAVNYFSVGSITGQYNAINNQSNYFGDQFNQNNSNFRINNIGAVFTIENNNSASKLKKTSIGLVINNDVTHENEVFFEGTNSRSLANYFLQHANTGFGGVAVPYDLTSLRSGESIGGLYDYLNGVENGFSAQQAMLGYQSYILNQDGNGGYTSNMGAGPYYQSSRIMSEGNNGRFTANIAFDFDNKYYFGLNLNYHSVNYLKSQRLYESAGSAIQNGVGEILFTNNTFTYGGGFSFNVGGLAKITEAFRVGASYQSPIWYRLNDEFEQRLETNIYEAGVSRIENFSPNIITLYERYSLRTPGQFTGSLAYIFGKSGLISFDYARKDYSAMQYNSPGFAYDYMNQYYSNELRAANEFRVGGEYRIDQISLRAGYRFAESPYKDTQIIGDLTNITGGIGYSFDNKRIDLSYIYSHQPYQQLYVSSGLQDAAQIKATQHMIALSYNILF